MNINWEDLFFYQVIDYRTLPTGDQVAEERRALIRNMWTQRIEGAKSNVEVDRFSLLKMYMYAYTLWFFYELNFRGTLLESID